MNRLHLGLIGGIGPASTVAYYQRLTAILRDRGLPLDLTIVNAHVPTLVKHNLADDRSAQAAVYKGLIDRLAAAGADCVGITSLGGHFCLNETIAVSALPIVSAITPLDAYFANVGYGTVGILGTAAVMDSALYGQMKVTKTMVPSDTGFIGKTYLDMALSGHCTDAQRTVFFDEAQRMIADGIDAVVLAGTDLGLAFDDHKLDFPVVDALDIHVDLLAKLAAGDADLADHTAMVNT